MTRFYQLTAKVLSSCTKHLGKCLGKNIPIFPTMQSQFLTTYHQEIPRRPPQWPPQWHHQRHQSCSTQTSMETHKCTNSWRKVRRGDSEFSSPRTEAVWEDEWVVVVVVVVRSLWVSSGFTPALRYTMVVVLHWLLMTPMTVVKLSTTASSADRLPVSQPAHWGWLRPIKGYVIYYLGLTMALADDTSLVVSFSWLLEFCQCLSYPRA